MKLNVSAVPRGHIVNPAPKETVSPKSAAYILLSGLLVYEYVDAARVAQDRLPFLR